MQRMSGPASIQPELLARSGFQPYRPDERLTHPAGAFPLEAYSSPFGLPPGSCHRSPLSHNFTHFMHLFNAGALFNPLQYPQELFMDPRFQGIFGRPSAHHPHAHALHSYPMSPYAAPHLYGMLPGAAAAALGMGVPGMHERLKMEEEHRVRLAREEEREREVLREKERQREQREREREQREKEQREKEQREREQREKEQREKEQRERELQEKERDARERERMNHHYSQQIYNNAARSMNMMGPLIPGLTSPMGLGRMQPHGMPSMSSYHAAAAAAAAAQRQSPHGPMGLNLGSGGLNLPPPPHSLQSLNLSHHLSHQSVPTSLAAMGHPGVSVTLGGHPSVSMSMAHSGMSLGLPHPGIPSAGLNLSHHSSGLNLSHPVSTSASHGHHGSLNLSHNNHAASSGPPLQSLNLSQSSKDGPTTALSHNNSSSNIPHAAPPQPPSASMSHYYPVSTTSAISSSPSQLSTKNNLVTTTAHPSHQSQSQHQPLHSSSYSLSSGSSNGGNSTKNAVGSSVISSSQRQSPQPIVQSSNSFAAVGKDLSSALSSTSIEIASSEVGNSNTVVQASATTTTTVPPSFDVNGSSSSSDDSKENGDHCGPSVGQAGVDEQSPTTTNAMPSKAKVDDESKNASSTTRATTPSTTTVQPSESITSPSTTTNEPSMDSSNNTKYDEHTKTTGL